MTQTHDFLGKKWVEISGGEFYKLKWDANRFEVWDDGRREYRYFKLAPEPKFPKVFGDGIFEVKVCEDSLSIEPSTMMHTRYSKKKAMIIKEAIEYAEKHWDNGGKKE